MGLCEGPMEEVIRIWADSNLIYDKYNKDDEDVVSPGFTQEESGNEGGKTKGAGKKKGEDGDSGRFKFRWYTGGTEQDRDPFMVEKQGEDLVPAYRCLAYLMFEDFALLDFGNRMPTITAEVAEKKRVKPSVQPFTTLDTGGNPSPGFNTDDPFSAVLDPIRNRMYVLQQGADSNNYIRVYNLVDMQEIDRKLVSDVPTDSQSAVVFRRFVDEGGTTTTDPTGLTMDNTRLLGVDGQGKLMWRASNSRVCLVDPNTLTITHVMGDSNVSTFHRDDQVAQLTDRRTIILGYPTFEGLAYITASLSQFNNVYFHDEDLIPLAFLNTSGTGLGTFAQLSPGLPTIDRIGSEYYLWGDELIYKGFFNSSNIPPIDAGTAATDDHEQDQAACLFPYFNWADSGFDDVSFTAVDIKIVFVCIPANCVGIIVSCSGTDPDLAGIYALKLDPDDGTVLWGTRVNGDTTSEPPQGVLFQVPILSSNRYVWYDDDDMWEVDFTSETVKRSRVPSTTPSQITGQSYIPERGGIVYWFTDTDNGNDRSPALLKIDRINQVPATVIDAIEKICAKCGIDTSQFDYTQLNTGEEVTGHIIEQPTTGRGALEELFKVFPTDVTESDGTLKWISRGQASLETIPENNMVGLDDDENEYVQTLIEEVELPEKVSISYIDPENKYQTGTQYFKRPRGGGNGGIVSSRNQVDISVPLAMKKNVAKQMAQRLLYSMWTERSQYQFALPWTYLRYDPGDVITIQMNDGFTFETRLGSFDIGADYSLSAEGIGTDVGTYQSVITSNEGGDVGGPVITDTSVPPIYSRACVLDIPTITDLHDKGQNQFIFYWGAAPFTPGFRYGTLKGLIGNAAPTLEGATVYEGLHGTVNGVVPDPDPWFYGTDLENSINLIPAFDFTGLYTWASIPPANWPSHDNAIIIGRELFYFRDVTVEADNSITISHFIRGERGTDAFWWDHEYGEKWILISNGFEETGADLSRVGQTWNYRISMPGPLAEGSPTTEITHDGASLRPRKPIIKPRSDDDPTSGDITISWERRTRIEGGALLRDSSDDVPLNEASESYEIYIMSTAYDPDNVTLDPNDSSTYVRMYTSTTQSVVYTSADRATDSHAITDPVYVVVFQVSDAVGRGYPGWKTLEQDGV